MRYTDHPRATTVLRDLLSLAVGPLNRPGGDEAAVTWLYEKGFCHLSEDEQIDVYAYLLDNPPFDVILHALRHLVDVRLGPGRWEEQMMRVLRERSDGVLPEWMQEEEGDAV